MIWWGKLQNNETLKCTTLSAWFRLDSFGRLFGNTCNWLISFTQECALFGGAETSWLSIHKPSETRRTAWLTVRGGSRRSTLNKFTIGSNATLSRCFWDMVCGCFFPVVAGTKRANKWLHKWDNTRETQHWNGGERIAAMWEAKRTYITPGCCWRVDTSGVLSWFMEQRVLCVT